MKSGAGWEAKPQKCASQHDVFKHDMTFSRQLMNNRFSNGRPLVSEIWVAGLEIMPPWRRRTVEQTLFRNYGSMSSKSMSVCHIKSIFGIFGGQLAFRPSASWVAPSYQHRVIQAPRVHNFSLQVATIFFLNFIMVSSSTNLGPPSLWHCCTKQLNEIFNG